MDRLISVPYVLRESTPPLLWILCLCSPSPLSMSLVVIRHGERLDYTTRDSGGNWTATASRPFDPPLTPHGIDQAKNAGLRIAELCTEHNLPAPTQAYSSPLRRCGETLSNAIKNCFPDGATNTISLEHGLVESANEDWYRSWCVPEANGTWGGPNAHRKGTPIDEGVLDKRSLEPATTLYNSIEAMNAYDTVACPVNTEHTSFRDLSGYKWGSFEKEPDQKTRMRTVADTLAARHNGETIIVCSHGGPCTHMFEVLTGEDWGKAGPCGYTAISVYSYTIEESGEVKWEKKAVNDVEHTAGIAGGTWH